MIFNQTPIRTSKNYGINDIKIDNIEIPKRIEEFNSLSITGDVSNFEISNDVNNMDLKYGNSKELEKLNKEKSNLNLNIKEQKSGVLRLNFCLNEEDVNLIENIEIKATKKTKSTIIIKYKSEDDKNFFHNGIIKTHAEENSRIDIIIVNITNIKTNNLLSIENTLENNAKVNYTIIDLGGKTNITNWYSNIIGNDAKANINSIYLGKEDQLFDINYISELYGERTSSNIEVQGALKDEAKKNFKGTIDFKKGCKKAKGDENEFCTLLSDKAKSKALPMLLCTEEDIEGNHSTACGKVDEKQLFYIMSRGFSYNEAIKLIVKSRFNNIIKNISDDELKEEISKQIDKILE